MFKFLNLLYIFDLIFQDYTTGINCEKCLDGYYRPLGETPHSRFPCRPCRCDVTLGSTGKCVTDDSLMSAGKVIHL